MRKFESRALNSDSAMQRFDISGVFDLAALRDSPHKVKLTEKEIETLSPMRRPNVNKPLAIAYGTGELPR